MVYIPFWICIFAGAAIDARERRFPNELAGACAVAAFAGVWLDRGINTALDHAGLAVIVYLALVLTESLSRRARHAPGIGMGTPRRSMPFVPSIPGWHRCVCCLAPCPCCHLSHRKIALLAIAAVFGADICHNRGCW